MAVALAVPELLALWGRMLGALRRPGLRRQAGQALGVGSAAPDHQQCSHPVLRCFTPSAALCTLRRRAAEEGSRESVDAGCMKLTAPWVRERAGRQRGATRAQQQQRGEGAEVPDIELCPFYEGLDAAGPEGRLEAGGWVGGRRAWRKRRVGRAGG